MLVALPDADGRCGAKAANLARLARAGFAVPAGFVVPEPRGDWEPRLPAALRALGPGPFAVRSSAVGEDGALASFAGQLHTTLRAGTAAEVAAAVRRVAASGRGGAVAAYSARVGQAVGRLIPVIVQVMVSPEAAGVLFTRHPVTGADQVVIEATPGLGDRLVDGTVTPDRWTVDGGTVTGADGAVTAARARELAEFGRRIEALFGCPQDVEWAIAGGRIQVLQARPVTPTRHGAAPARAAAGGGEVLLAGTPASPGVATGPARVVAGLDDFGCFGAGEVLVCRTTSPAWTPLLARAAAVVAEEGGLLSHAAIVAREFGIPAVLAARGATSALAGGPRVLVDGGAGTVSADPGRTR